MTNTEATEACSKADKVIEELARIAFSNICDFVQFRDDGTMVIDHVKAIEVGAKVTVVARRTGRGEDAKEVLDTCIRMPNKMRALHLLGKHLGLAFK